MFGQSRRRIAAWSRFLGETPTFGRFPEKVRELIASRMTKVRARPGEVLMRQGEPGDRMLVLAGGRVEVRVHDKTGEPHVLAQPETGAVLGEMALLTDEPRSADVVALTAVRALALSSTDFRDLVAEQPDIAVVLTHLVADRLGQAERDGLGDKVLEGYRLGRRLGIGATAVVYDAQEMDGGDFVALKMLSHRLVYDDDAIAKFHREVAILEGLDHPGIARVRGHFEAFGTWFMVLEKVEGCTLHDVVQTHCPLPDDQVRAVIGQLAAALDHVHRAGVVHRDLKPANVMLGRDGALKLTDFGIAQPATDLKSSPLPGDMLLSGTPMYMPPEQFISSDVDTRADLYALGCIAFELVTSRPVIEATGFGELIARKRDFVLADREAIRADLPDDVYDLLRQTLSPDPDGRTLDLSMVAKWATPVDPALLT